MIRVNWTNETTEREGATTLSRFLRFHGAAIVPSLRAAWRARVAHIGRRVGSVRFCGAGQDTVVITLHRHD